MSEQRSFLRAKSRRPPSQKDTYQSHCSNAHSSSECIRRGRVYITGRMLLETSTLALTHHTHPFFETQRLPKMFPESPPYGKSAKTRTGPPDPPSSLIGAATRNAPASGKAVKSARFSR